MSDKYPGFFTAIFGSGKKTKTGKKPIPKIGDRELMFPESGKKIYYPVKSKEEEEAEPVEDVEDA